VYAAARVPHFSVVPFDARVGLFVFPARWPTFAIAVHGELWLASRVDRTAPKIDAYRCYRRCTEEGNMRATVTLDDELLKTAHEYTGVTERAELIREALKSLIAREAGRRLLALAGTAPNMEKVRPTRVDER
jgi:Arc/MetJ family transcription regulator